MLLKISIMIGIIVGTLTIIDKLYAFFTNNISIGSRLWGWLATALWWLVSFVQHRKKILILIVALLLILTVGLAAYQYCWIPHTKTVEGKIYYKPNGERSGLVPVADVIVYLSKQRQFKSEPTDREGRFVIRDIPACLPVSHLTAYFAGMDFPFDHNERGEYAIIPRKPEPIIIIREIPDPWVEASADQCLSENGQQIFRKRRFLLDTSLPADHGMHEALLTVEWKGAADVVILKPYPYVILPSAHSGLYRNAMDDLDERVAHRWRFKLPENGLRIRLEVCLASQHNSVTPSQKNLHTYYSLQ